MASAGLTNGTTKAQPDGFTSANGAHPKIHLYTNHGCPYAQRAHITLTELGLPYEETIIDLSKPREPWYLEINPRGLVPAIRYSNGVIEDQIITESAIVAQFLADSRPSHLLPASLESPSAPLQRARINFFTDTWNTKVASFMFGALRAEGAEKDDVATKWFAAIEKELEPLLADADPFFGGAKELTLAEVHAAPFLLRWYAFAKDGEMIQSWFAEKLDGLPNFGKWARAVMEKESVQKVWDEGAIVGNFKQRIANMKKDAAAKAQK